jgi:histidine triad (HIT) family protein
MIKKAKFLAKEAKLRIKYMTNGDCLFCKIIRGEIKPDFVKETDKVVVFADINPISEVHLLIVPKRHIDSVLTISEKDSGDLIAMYNVARELVLEKKLDAFRLSFNGGKYQHVGHLHMHLMAGKKLI